MQKISNHKIHQQIRDYLEYCEKVRGMTPATMAMKRNVLSRFVRITGLTDVTRLNNQIFNRWVAQETERGLSARSMNTYNSTILALVRYQREIGHRVPLKNHLIKKLKETKPRRRFYTAREVAKVTQYANRQTSLMIKIMFETGMRIAEITHLRCENLDGRHITFIGKGKKSREVYLRAETARELANYIKYTGVTDYVWAVQDGISHLPPTVVTVRKHLKKPFIAAGFSDFYPHALRHSFATDLQLRGASVAEIKEMLGHANIATTERYLHGFEGRLRELFDKYR